MFLPFKCAFRNRLQHLFFRFIASSKQCSHPHSPKTLCNCCSAKVLSYSMVSTKANRCALESSDHHYNACSAQPEPRVQAQLASDRSCTTSLIPLQASSMTHVLPSESFTWTEKQLPCNSAPTASAPIGANFIHLLTIHNLLLSWKQAADIAGSLSKFRLSTLVVCTAVVGCTLAASTSLAIPSFLAHPYLNILLLALGTGLTSASANTINQILEIPFDYQMTRTRNRVLVCGLTTPGRAGLFAIGCAGVGITTLYLTFTPIVAALAAANILLYVGIYTPLKQFSQANTWIGSLVGAVPPLMGWAAATGDIHSGSLFLASLLYVWQFPHFMALSWNLRNEYSKAGYMMTAALEPTVCKHVAFRYAVASNLVCLAGAGCSAISLGPWAGCALGLVCLPPNIGLMYYAWQFARTTENDGSAAAARRLFRATLVHLPAVLVAALIGTYFCSLVGNMPITSG